jgi:hypothetical protein
LKILLRFFGVGIQVVEFKNRSPLPECHSRMLFLCPIDGLLNYTR